MKVAVVGAGISGLVAAHVHAKSGVEVVLYEKKDHLGGHAMTVTFDGLDLDLAFINFNNMGCTPTSMIELVDMVEAKEMSFSNPICCSIWSCPLERVMSFPAFDVFTFCRNHQLLQPLGYQQWNTTLGWCSHNYVNKVKDQFESWGCQIRIGCEVYSVSSADGGCTVVSKDGSQEMYSGCIMAVHAPDALKMLGSQATFDEKRVLGAFQYANIDIFLHRDKKFMPQDRAVWSACNFVGNTDGKAYMTYWLNALQNIGETSLPFLVTLNPDHTPEHTLVKWSTALPLPSAAASKASVELHTIQGKRGIWFCGTCQGHGFHEDGLKSSLIAAHGLLGKSCAISTNPRRCMVPSLMEKAARHFVVRFLGHYINTGHLILLEEGGTILNFKGTRKSSSLKTILRVHNPRFYWKVMTEADVSLADSYIDGDFSLEDKDEGLMKLIMILIANGDLDPSGSRFNQTRGLGLPWLFTGGIASVKHFFRRISGQNTVTQARMNITRMHDLDNEHFALFLDESMTLSCAVFKSKDEDLKVAQMRKISLLIEKARINEKHEVLDIGEMIEAVGHEHLEGFFSKCESILAEDGLFVLQFISIPDQHYNEHRKNSDFLKEYLMPEECFTSLSRVTTAMASASRLCVEHVENIGIHYHQTLRYWRKNFFDKQSEILAKGFDEKFLRAWDYYYNYCAAQFKSRTLRNYQVVFSRPGNVSTFSNPYEGFPSPY
ncbi:hypothetical protein JRO89_XS04G0054500 [Xanthoceras sorbifolium]|uniref:Amine oxidase domain-containing protein n=1 Tax=Xanthoceras sorbifolium TaxID=99658 RepID=A0ABQ8I483_9ROSI|nr:hypothetical protein JRO89_XS04G0054500 [Xanthoceras sorbifolium]